MAVLAKPGAEAKRREAEEGFLAATESLLDDGASYAELTIEQIAERAKRPRTAFYLYFRDKRQLLMRLAERVATTFYEEAEPWYRPEGGIAEVRPAIEAIMNTYREHAALLGAVVEASGYDERIGGFWRSVIERFVAATRDKLILEGEPEASAEAKAFALTWMVERTLYQQLAGGEPLDSDAVADALVEVLERSAYGA